MKIPDFGLGEIIGFLAFFALLAFTFKHASDFNTLANTATSSVKNLVNVY